MKEKPLAELHPGRSQSFRVLSGAWLGGKSQGQSQEAWFPGLTLTC